MRSGAPFVVNRLPCTSMKNIDLLFKKSRALRLRSASANGIPSFPIFFCIAHPNIDPVAGLCRNCSLRKGHFCRIAGFVEYNVKGIGGSIGVHVGSPYDCTICPSKLQPPEFVGDVDDVCAHRYLTDICIATPRHQISPRSTGPGFRSHRRVLRIPQRSLWGRGGCCRGR